MCEALGQCLASQKKKDKKKKIVQKVGHKDKELGTRIEQRTELENRSATQDS